VLIHTLQGLPFFNQLMRIRKGWQCHTAPRFDTDFVHRKPETFKVIGQQTKRVTRLGNKQPGTMHGHHL